MKNNKMKAKLWLFIALLIVVSVQAQDKKQLKKINKKYNTYNQGDIFAKAERVAILGNNLRFRLAARQAEETSWKEEKYYKFSAYSVLEGLSEELLQDITNEYYSMLKTRFEDMGIEVIPYSEISEAKSYEKMKDKGTRETENIKDSWGVAQIYNYDAEPYITWTSAAPFGPQQKLPKELDAILFSSLVTVDFSHIGIDIEQYRKSDFSLSGRVIYTEAKSSIIPAINIDGYTYSTSGIKMTEDNTHIYCINPKGKQFIMKLDLNESEIESEKTFATEVYKCDDCVPVFVKNYTQIMESGMGTVFVKVNQELYKVAVLDALGKYLDEIFMVINSQRK